VAAPLQQAGPPSDRVRLRRRRERGSHDRDVIEAILDEALVAHLGIAEPDGQPIVIPTLHARCGEVVYCHGSAASRTLRALRDGVRACLTVSLLDGLVLARAAMHHSANYRSVMIFGVARAIDDPAEKRAALRAIVEHIVPGRAEHVRGPSDSELKATTVLALPIEEASAKIRTGGPSDDDEDLALPCWAGTLPMRMQAGPPEPAPGLDPEIEIPPHAASYRRPGWR
jgi:uncharacterized protein